MQRLRLLVVVWRWEMRGLGTAKCTEELHSLQGMWEARRKFGPGDDNLRSSNQQCEAKMHDCRREDVVWVDAPIELDETHQLP